MGGSKSKVGTRVDNEGEMTPILIRLQNNYLRRDNRLIPSLLIGLHSVHDTISLEIACINYKVREVLRVRLSAAHDSVHCPG